MCNKTLENNGIDRFNISKFSRKRFLMGGEIDCQSFFYSNPPPPFQKQGVFFSLNSTALGL